MSNIEKLQDYLLGANRELGYLLDDKRSNGKVIMISGEWGSGKTHFWQKKIGNSEKLKEQKKANIYISLYGKTSLKEIENEVFTKAYYKSVGKDNENKDVIEKLTSTFSSVSSFVDQFSTVKITPIVDFVNSLNNNSKNATAKQFMADGLIICFDDFERKSSRINLNDLFGFITNLALQYKATIVIILNDDVFEGKEKEVFKYVKEKSVNKFFKFQPSSDDLLDLIYSKYNINDKYKSIILDAINDIKSINARIYENILENLQEYIIRYPEMTDEEIRYFVLTIINFNLNHLVFKFYDYPVGLNEKVLASNFYSMSLSIKVIHELIQHIEQLPQHGNSKLELIDLLNQGLEQKYKNIEEVGKKKEIMPTER